MVYSYRPEPLGVIEESDTALVLGPVTVKLQGPQVLVLALRVSQFTSWRNRSNRLDLTAFAAEPVALRGKNFSDWHIIKLAGFNAHPQYEEFRRGLAVSGIELNDIPETN